MNKEKRIKFKIMFGIWSIMCDSVYQYNRIGFIHIPKIFGGLSIPIPIVEVFYLKGELEKW